MNEVSRYTIPGIARVVVDASDYDALAKELREEKEKQMRGPTIRHGCPLPYDCSDMDQVTNILIKERDDLQRQLNVCLRWTEAWTAQYSQMVIGHSTLTQQLAQAESQLTYAKALLVLAIGADEDSSIEIARYLQIKDLTNIRADLDAARAVVEKGTP